MAGNSLLVAAIDFGTTFSGWAFSFRHEFERDPTKVSAKTWSGGQLVSLKGPTCVLIKPDGKTLHSFGYEAESKYADLATDGEHTKWYYFRRFKMLLFDKQNQEIKEEKRRKMDDHIVFNDRLTGMYFYMDDSDRHEFEGLGRNDVLEDESSKKLSAKTVFSLSIRYLKDDLLKMSESRIAGGGLQEKDIYWVLTVPAIWNDAAKQFMREAAQEAGILEEQLTIALEPEAASLYCRHLPVEKSGIGKTSLAAFGPGKRYLVLDAGGGTVDITVHEVMAGGHLKELHKASGGAWGGTKVDDAFLSFLNEIAGSSVMSRFKDKHMEDFLDIFRDFELKKREIDPNKDNQVTIRIPTALADLVKEMRRETLQETIKKTAYASKVKIIGDKMRIEQSVAKGFFDNPVSSIIEHVSSLLREHQNKDVEAILMVGGFSESPLLQETVRKKFPNMKIIVPDEPGLAVLKGAVIYGHSPTAISQRVSKYTYGTNVLNTLMHLLESFQEILDVKDRGPRRASKEFSILVKAGQTLEVGQAQNEASYTTVSENQTQMGMDIYATLKAEPEFVDEEGCYKIGTFTIPVSGRGEGREVKVKMIFGGTEIHVECKEVATGKITNLKVDFLS